MDYTNNNNSKLCYQTEKKLNLTVKYINTKKGNFYSGQLKS